VPHRARPDARPGPGREMVPYVGRGPRGGAQTRRRRDLPAPVLCGLLVAAMRVGHGRPAGLAARMSGERRRPQCAQAGGGSSQSARARRSSRTPPRPVWSAVDRRARSAAASRCGAYVSHKRHRCRRAGRTLAASALPSSPSSSAYRATTARVIAPSSSTSAPCFCGPRRESPIPDTVARWHADAQLTSGQRGARCGGVLAMTANDRHHQHR